MYDGQSSRGTSPDGRELNELRTVNAKLRKRIAECMAGSGVGRDSIPGDSTPHEEVRAHVSAFPSTLEV